MHLTTPQPALARALSQVSRAVSARSTLPVLANVYARADGGTLELGATNLELGITVWIPATVTAPGATTIPAKTFAELIGTLDSDVSLVLNERTQAVAVQSGRSNTTIKTIPADEFPPMPAIDSPAMLCVPAALLAEMTHQVAFCASTDEGRPILTGVLLTVKADTISMSAADGFRLAKRTAVLETPAPQNVSAVIPARALTELARMSDTTRDVEIVVPPGRGQIVFRQAGRFQLVSQLIEGTFPDIDQLIPKRHTTRAVVPVAAMLSAVKRAEIFAREGSHICRLDIGEGVVKVGGRSEEMGSQESEIESDVTGDGLAIAFNVRYLKDYLEAVKAQSVAVETMANTSPGVLRPVDGPNWAVIIMPMMLGS